MSRMIQNAASPLREKLVPYAPLEVTRALRAAGYHDTGVAPQRSYTDYTEFGGRYGTLLQASCLAAMERQEAAIAAAGLAEIDQAAVAEQFRRRSLTWDERAEIAARERAESAP